MKTETRREYLNKTHFSHAYKAAEEGLLHHSYSTDENADENYEYFATREEAEANACKRTGYDPASKVSWNFEARSVIQDEDGDLYWDEEANA